MSYQSITVAVSRLSGETLAVEIADDADLATHRAVLAVAEDGLVESTDFFTGTLYGKVDRSLSPSYPTTDIEDGDLEADEVSPVGSPLSDFSTVIELDGDLADVNLSDLAVTGTIDFDVAAPDDFEGFLLDLFDAELLDSDEIDTEDGDEDFEVEDEDVDFDAVSERANDIADAEELLGELLDLLSEEAETLDVNDNAAVTEHLEGWALALQAAAIIDSAKENA